MASAKDFVYPQPYDDDDDDVVWALQAGNSEWLRGGNADALVWLRRAIESANAAGNAFRAGEIQVAVDELMEVMWAGGVSSQGAPSEEALEIENLSADERDDVELQDGDEDDLINGELDDRDLEEIGEDDLIAEEAWLDDEETPPGRAAGSTEGAVVAPPLDFNAAAADLNQFQDALSEEAGDELDEEAGDELDDGAGDELDDDHSAPATAAIDDRLADDFDDEDVAAADELDELDEGLAADLLAADLVTPDLATPDLPATDQSEADLAAGDLPAFDLPAADSPELDRETPADEDQQLAAEGVADISPPESNAGFKALVRSMSSPATDLGSAPIDQLIAVELENEAPRLSLPPGSLRANAPGSVDGVPLSECLGLEDLPPDALTALASAAQLVRLVVDEELTDFGAALVTHGAVAVVTAISDEPAMIATKGDVVFTEGSLVDGTKLRVVCTAAKTVVATWTSAELQDALQNSPWVKDALRQLADRFQALAGTTLGILGERLDATLRRSVTDRMEVRAYAPGELVITKGVGMAGLFIVGAGRVDIETPQEAAADHYLPGDFLFPEVVLAAAPTPATARAGAKGALLLFAGKHIVHELVTSVPPLLEALVS